MARLLLEHAACFNSNLVW